MIRITFLILCSVACFSQVTSNQLTKEADVQTFYNPIEDSDIYKQFVNLFFQFTPQAVENVNALVTRSAVVSVPDLIETFNTGINSNILIISEGFVKVDAAVLEKALLNLAKDVTKMLFPNDKVQQLMAYLVIQKQIKDTTKQLPPVIDQSKIPVAVLSAAISEPAYRVAKVQPKAGFLAGLQYEICNATVNYVSALVNTAIINAETQLANISVTSSSNVVLTKLVEFVLSLVNQALVLLESLNDSVESLLCDSLLSPSRRRRDVGVASGQFERNILQTVDTRDITSVATNFLNVIWTVISSVLKQYLVKAASLLVANLKTYIEGALATLLASVLALIDQYL